eukprot:4900750-Pleurochrysis_carterae.AAC.1
MRSRATTISAGATLQGQEWQARLPVCCQALSARRLHRRRSLPKAPRQQPSGSVPAFPGGHCNQQYKGCSGDKPKFKN